jgi:hypothetical protein
MQVAGSEEVPVNVAGSSIFGLYPTISLEETWNMFLSDEWLVNYAGFKKKVDVSPEAEGRGFFVSIRGKFTISVSGSTVYRENSNLIPQFIGVLETSTGEVYMDENLSNQICIVDGQDAWIYNYDTNIFEKQILTFLTPGDIIPSDVCYHNTFFLIGSNPSSINPQNWYAFTVDIGDPNKISLDPLNQFEIQTKPDVALAIRRLPGRGNNIIVFGFTVAEVWTQVGGEENYRRIQSFNIDNGTVAISTIAANDDFVAWLSQNENNKPCIRITDGSSSKRISTDGIDNRLSEIKFPAQSCAFFYRQVGHLFYQLTFYNPKDNLTLIYDFTTEKFFHVSDEKQNFHPARQIVLFNLKNYFISINDGSIYQMDAGFVTYDYNTAFDSMGEEIPRIRVCKEIRKKNSDRFRVGQFTFTMEQGVNDFFVADPDELVCNGSLITESGNFFIVTEQGDTILAEDGFCFTANNRPRVDMSFSKNGNQSFSNIVSRNLNAAGNYRNQVRWWKMGQANTFTVQLRFWGFQRFVVSDGVAEIY